MNFARRYSVGWFIVATVGACILPGRGWREFVGYVVVFVACHMRGAAMERRGQKASAA